MSRPGSVPVTVLTRRALVACGAAALLIGALSGWTIGVVQVVLQSGGLTGVQAYAALVSAIFGALIAAFAAVGALGGYALGLACAPVSRLVVAGCVGLGAVVALGAVLALGTGGTLGWRPVAIETVVLGLYVFAVGAAGYGWASRSRTR